MDDNERTDDPSTPTTGEVFRDIFRRDVDAISQRSIDFVQGTEQEDEE